MHHDIKNFSELTAINTNRTLIVEVSMRKHGRTESKVKFNGFTVYVDKFTFEIDLLDPINFEIELLDFDEGSSGIAIEYFKVNGLEVLPRYQHLTNKHTAYIDTLGVWKLEIPSKFYAWFHQISHQGWIA